MQSSMFSKVQTKKLLSYEVQVRVFFQYILVIVRL